ncbi:MAG: hypothetical protein M3O36_13075 [Myxococcota bacterium]|nr:hypothetical protein [Myxococcota bacterium]
MSPPLRRSTASPRVVGATSFVCRGTAVLCASVFALACDESSVPLGRGDDTVGRDVSSPPVAAEATPSDDSPFAPIDGPYGPPPDGYLPFTWCAQCACPAGTYCFGGATGNTSFSGSCVEADAAAMGIGCRPLPPPCASAPDCPCLLQSLPPMPCYPVCTQVGGFTVYCPSP